MSQPIVLGAPSLLWVSCEASSKSDVSEPHGVAELCDVAVHVEHMSHGLCPMSICPAPREGISRLLQYHGGATAWSSSSPHACCTQAPCVPGPWSRGAIDRAVGRSHSEAVSDFGGWGCDRISRFCRLYMIVLLTSFVGSGCLSVQARNCAGCQIVVVPQSQTQPTLVPASV